MAWRFWRAWFAPRPQPAAEEGGALEIAAPSAETPAPEPADPAEAAAEQDEHADTRPVEVRRPSRPRETAAAPAPARGAATAAAVLDPAENAPSAAQPDAPGWLTKDEVLALRETRDEQQIARRLMALAPGASKQEVLFRYHVSKSVLLGEYELPVLPGSAAEIMRLSRNPMSGIADVMKVVEQDAALVKAVTSAANSAFFASLYECNTLRQAIVRIGLDRVEQITMAETLRSRLVNVRGQSERIAQLGLHGIAVALTSKLAADLVGAKQGNAYLGGLFHDVGKFVVLGIAASVQTTLRTVIPPPLITSAFTAFHVTLGELACRSWQLPEEICAAVRDHHTLEAAIETPLGKAVFLGNRLATGLDRPDRPLLPLPEADPVLEAFGLDRAALEELRVAADAELEAYKSFF